MSLVRRRQDLDLPGGRAYMKTTTIFVTAVIGHSNGLGMLTYAIDYKDELQRLGPASFQRAYFQPVLVTLGMAGEINPSASSEGTSVVNLNEGTFACTRLTGRVFPVVKPRNSMPGPISLGRTSENDIASPSIRSRRDIASSPGERRIPAHRHGLDQRNDRGWRVPRAAEATAAHGRRDHLTGPADVGVLLCRGFIRHLQAL